MKNMKTAGLIAVAAIAGLAGGVLGSQLSGGDLSASVTNNFRTRTLPYNLVLKGDIEVKDNSHGDLDVEIGAPKGGASSPSYSAKCVDGKYVSGILIHSDSSFELTCAAL